MDLKLFTGVCIGVWHFLQMLVYMFDIIYKCCIWVWHSLQMFVYDFEIVYMCLYKGLAIFTNVCK